MESCWTPLSHIDLTGGFPENDRTVIRGLLKPQPPRPAGKPISVPKVGPDSAPQRAERRLASARLGKADAGQTYVTAGRDG